MSDEIKPLTGWPLLRHRLKYFLLRQYNRFGFVLTNAGKMARMRSDLDDCRSQLINLCVLDLGYDAEPRYGHAPLRHQIAWMFGKPLRLHPEYTGWPKTFDEHIARLVKEGAQQRRDIEDEVRERGGPWKVAPQGYVENYLLRASKRMIAESL